MNKIVVRMTLMTSHGGLAALGLLVASGCTEARSENVSAEVYVSTTQAELFEPHVTICSKGITKKVHKSALNTHLLMGAYLGPCATYGDRATLGDGYAQTYVQIDDGATWALGVEFSETMLNHLPQMPVHDGANCWDVNGDGELSTTTPPLECVGGHHRVMFLPPTAGETPFKWVLLNWNAMGHEPTAIYGVPHFDFHFYIMDYVDRNLIRPGPCGLLINCDDFNRGVAPVPPQYLHPDYSNVGAVEARMGNHLADLMAPEFQPGGTFSRTFIMGVYDKHVTFWEPMITKEFFDSLPNLCLPIKLPAAYEIAGDYPTQYCIRYRAARKEYSVSLEGFVHRTASP